jgi:CIC family chloride channel protein
MDAFFVGLITFHSRGTLRSRLKQEVSAGTEPSSQPVSMKPKQERAVEAAEERGSLPALAALSLLVGAASGFVGAVFRLALEQADRGRNAAIAWAHDANPAGLGLVIASCAGATAFAAWLVRRFSPHASGSGIPHVEAVLNQELPQAAFPLVPVKFVGGLLAIGSGLALGREGPSVQMGASIGHLLGRVGRRNLPDCLVLLAAGAGAGLATAFNAPIAGAVFVLEELVRRFDTRITIATFGASTGAIAVSRALLGDVPDFRVGPLPYSDSASFPVHLALGILAGLLGVAYNRTILGALSATERLRRWPMELRAALIGATVGLIAWFVPDLVGGGDPITQRTLAGTDTLLFTALVFLLRFGLGPVSYAARTPGGLFAPMLVLGAQSGLLFGIVCDRWLPTWSPGATALAVVGMAAFFAAVVRAPVTGIILVTEMTGNFTLLLPMLSACFAAMLVPTLLGKPPIYDSLREGTLRIDKREESGTGRQPGCSTNKSVQRPQ